MTPQPRPARLSGPPRRRGAALAVVLALLGAPASGQEEAASPNRVDYRIRARLDGETKRLSGRETLRWTNGTADAVSDLWFHLYLNAFSNNRSTHLSEGNGKLRRGHELKDGWGWSRVTAARLVSAPSDASGEEETAETDLFPTLAFAAPDDGHEDDRTVFSLDLPSPVPPGGTIEVALEWESQLPRVRRRTGYKGDFLLVAQWFPKLGVYEEGRGWNAHQFHANSEFYSDYGTYDVTLDLPATYRDAESGEPLVGGSGLLVSSELKGDERLLVRFVAPSGEDQRNEDRTGKRALVHDFTWTADPRFVTRSETFRHSAWATEFAKDVELAARAFGPDADLGLQNVDMRLLIHPERAEQASRHFRATAAALFFYGLWFGEYPYGNVTIVDPAWGARAAGGMEYPTLFTCGTRLFTTADMHTPESVTVHEAGHQFWYGLVGNNEFEAAWLDEGLNSYTDSEVLWRVYGPRRETTDYSRVPLDGERAAEPPGGGLAGDVLTGRRIPIWFTDRAARPFRVSGFLEYWRDLPDLHLVARASDPRWHDRQRYLRSPDADPLDTWSWEHVDRTSYSTNSYSRTAVVLRTLRGLVGEEAFLRGMRHFAETWRFRHPYPDDFFAAFQEGSGVEEDLSWFFEELFRGTGTGDWSVEVEQHREPAPRGYFPDEETGEYVKVAEPDEEAKSDESEDDPEDPWTIEVTLRRRGSLRLPVDLLLTFENGETRELAWTREEQGEGAWTRHVLTSTSKLASARIDPSEKVWVDFDMSNNQWFAERDEVTAWRWSERALSQLARYFQWFSRLGG